MRVSKLIVFTNRLTNRVTNRFKNYLDYESAYKWAYLSGKTNIAVDVETTAHSKNIQCLVLPSPESWTYWKISKSDELLLAICAVWAMCICIVVIYVCRWLTLHWVSMSSPFLPHLLECTFWKTITLFFASFCCDKHKTQNACTRLTHSLNSLGKHL